jgi:hypothetical protein
MQQPDQQPRPQASQAPVSLTEIQVIAGQSFPFTFQSTMADLEGVAQTWVEDSAGTIIVPKSDGSNVVRVGTPEYVYRATVGPVPGGVGIAPFYVYAALPGSETSFTFEEIAILPEAPPAGGNVGSIGMLGAWITSDDVAAALGMDAVTGADYTQQAIEASEVLYELSGRRFRGIGQSLERPGGVIPFGWSPNARTYMSWFDQGAYWVWPGYDPRYMEPWCYGGEKPIVLRNTPIQDDSWILEVRIDGQIVSPDTYYLVDGHYLHRVQPNYWPMFQRVDKKDGDIGTFHVLYQHGSYPPALGLEAAKQLAAQLVLTEIPGKRVTLPWGTQQIIRSGVTITRETMKEFRQQGFGLPLVDLFLDTWGRDKEEAVSAVWSPDLPEESSFYPEQH